MNTIAAAIANRLPANGAKSTSAFNAFSPADHGISTPACARLFCIVTTLNRNVPSPGKTSFKDAVCEMLIGIQSSAISQ